jgi:hypothetical protein
MRWASPMIDATKNKRTEQLEQKVSKHLRILQQKLFWVVKYFKHENNAMLRGSKKQSENRATLFPVH